MGFTYLNTFVHDASGTKVLDNGGPTDVLATLLNTNDL